MRKMTALFVTICLCFILCSCGTKKADNNTQEQRLEGYYLNPLTGERYCFEITEHGSGDYGGTLTDLSDTTNVSVWSIEDGTVYINGQAMYIYDGTSLYKDGDIAVGLKYENNAIFTAIQKISEPRSVKYGKNSCADRRIRQRRTRCYRRDQEKSRYGTCRYNQPFSGTGYEGSQRCSGFEI